MTRIINEIKQKITQLKSEGLNNSQISKQLGILISQVQYHSSEEFRKDKIKKVMESFKKLPKEIKKERGKKRRNYNKIWYKKKYNEDEKFREKHKERVRLYQRKKYKEDGK